MLGELPEGIIGTNPKYPPIANHDWMKPQNYDNYPSDNNPVRVVPKLHDIWNHDPKQNVSIVPNATVQPLGVRTAEQEAADMENNIREVVREAKKAMMAGLEGPGIADHLRSRFTTGNIEAASEELKKLSSEMGLLGNVYVDASAFSSIHEAESFLNKHRSRLASDILFDTDKVNPSLISSIASKFRKNVVTAVDYNPQMLARYKNHLVAAGRIPEDFEVNSKEDLREAFLYQAPEPEAQPAPEKKEQRLSSEEVNKKISQNIEIKASQEKEAKEAILLKTVRPIVSFVRESISKGKDMDGIKEMLRSKYASNDLESAAPYIGIAISKNGLTASNLKTLAEESTISEVMADELLRIGKQFPVKKADYPKIEKKDRNVGVAGYFYNLSKSTSSDRSPYRRASLEALKKGIGVEQLKDKLMTKMSEQEADKVLSEAMTDLNALPAGTIANKAQKPEKQAVVEDLKPKKTLPDESTIASSTKEILGYFSDCSSDIDVGQDTGKYKSLEIDEIDGKAGIDGVLS